eukprot:gene3389-3879_t
MEKFFAIAAFLSFITKLVINLIFLDDVKRRFAEFDTELTPAESPLLVCRAFFSFIYTLVFILYCISKTFHRNQEANKDDYPRIISSKFYATFALSCILEAIYIGIWSRGFTFIAFLFICAACFAQYLALHASFTALYDAITRDIEFSKRTIWCNRFLVQSGLMFDCGWNTILCSINLSIVLCHNIGLSSFQSSVIGLIALSAGLIIWFLVQNVSVEKYVRFIVSEYIAILMALASLLSRDRQSDMYFPYLLFSLMSVALILLFLRIFVIMCMENKRKNQEQLYTVVSV